MTSSALVSTSTDRMFDSQYLRVTLKSLAPINRFVMKAVSRTDLDSAGLGTWYLPFQDENLSTNLSPTSRYLNCSDSSHNSVANSPDIVPGTQTVIYFQWMPEQHYEGYVRFRAVVQTGNNVDWEEATPIEVKIMKKEISSPATRRPNQGSTSDESSRENTTSVIDVDTTRWSHNHDNNKIGGESSTLTNNDEISSVILPRVTESYERLEAEHGGWRETKNRAQHSQPTFKLYFLPLFTYIYFYARNKR